MQCNQAYKDRSIFQGDLVTLKAKYTKIISETKAELESKQKELQSLRTDYDQTEKDLKQKIESLQEKIVELLDQNDSLHIQLHNARRSKVPHMNYNMYL